jgi:hypothetical protein
MRVMAKIIGMGVSVTYASEPCSCKRCGRATLILVHPNDICPPCWAIDVLKIPLARLHDFASALGALKEK